MPGRIQTKSLSKRNVAQSRHKVIQLEAASREHILEYFLYYQFVFHIFPKYFPFFKLYFFFIHCICNFLCSQFFIYEEYTLKKKEYLLNPSYYIFYLSNTFKNRVTVSLVCFYAFQNLARILSFGTEHGRLPYRGHTLLLPSLREPSNQRHLLISDIEVSKPCYYPEVAEIIVNWSSKTQRWIRGWNCYLK